MGEITRWYRIAACRDVPGEWVPRLEWSEQVVSGMGVAEAFAAVAALGWWPTAVVRSAWVQDEV